MATYYNDFRKLEALGFAFVGNGIWINKEKALSVALNEDYKQTYRAFSSDRPYSRFVISNKAGNQKRFRTADAAAAYVVKTFPEGGHQTMTITWTRGVRTAYWTGAIGTETFEQRERFGIAKAKVGHRRQRFTYQYVLFGRVGTTTHRVGTYDTLIQAKAAAELDQRVVDIKAGRVTEGPALLTAVLNGNR